MYVHVHVHAKYRVPYNRTNFLQRTTSRLGLT